VLYYIRLRKIVIQTVCAVAFVVLAAFLIVYISNIRIYEPLKFSFDGLVAEQVKDIRVYGISPLNKKRIVIDHNTQRKWDSPGMYFKSIGFELPDSIACRLIHVSVYINNRCVSYSLSELRLKSRESGIVDYRFPASLQSTFSFRKVLLLTINSGIIVFSFSALLILSAFAIWRRRLRTKGVKGNKEILPHYLKLFICALICCIASCFIFSAWIFVAYGAINWLTAIFFILLLFATIAVIISIIAKLTGVSKRGMQNILKIIALVCIGSVVFEMGLRIGGINKTYNEVIGSFYVSGYAINPDFNNTKHHHTYTYKPYSVLFDCRNEFRYKVTTNSEGLRDNERQIEYPDSVIRIIAIGNSFTEGVGAPQDSTWPALLEQKLSNKLQKKVEVFNAGISSSDPFFGYKLLEEQLLKYSPKMVLLAPGSSDFDFHMYRGGFERFTENGLQYRKAPKRETWYALSYIYRFLLNSILGYDGFFTKKQIQLFHSNTLRDVEECIYRFEALAQKNKFKLVVVFIDDTKPRYRPLIEKLKNDGIISTIDLFEYNKEYFMRTGYSRSNYYWPIDRHCNSRGYNLFAEGITENLMQMGLIIENNQ